MSSSLVDKQRFPCCTCEFEAVHPTERFLLAWATSRSTSCISLTCQAGVDMSRGTLVSRLKSYGIIQSFTALNADHEKKHCQTSTHIERYSHSFSSTYPEALEVRHVGLPFKSLFYLITSMLRSANGMNINSDIKLLVYSDTRFQYETSWDEN